ncbi:MAG: bifunctional hydroxymethylpyrimidine kinase/phosphomethylpyrimidine kinase [Thermoprotei archaeon]
MKFGLTIAGSDSGAGAGVQEDLKTFTMLGVYCATVITSITAQNTYEVIDLFDLPPKSVGAQIDAVMTDFPIVYGKSGMLGNHEIVEVVSSKVDEYGLKLVVDPVMVSKSGAKLLSERGIETLRDKLLPRALMVTPNIHEASILSGVNIKSRQDMVEAAERIFKAGPKYVVVKGGHLEGPLVHDLLYSSRELKWFEYRRINTKNNHGAGCTLSSAVAARLAHGDPPIEAYTYARRFLQRALENSLNIGRGHGPLNPMYRLSAFRNQE